MAIAAKTDSPERLTYEQYLAEGEINERYDILDGVRIFMPGPKWRHQRAGVRECWVVDLHAETVELLRLTREGAESIALYTGDQTLQSLVFPDPAVPIAAIFAR